MNCCIYEFFWFSTASFLRSEKVGPFLRILLSFWKSPISWVSKGHCVLRILYHWCIDRYAINPTKTVWNWKAKSDLKMLLPTWKSAISPAINKKYQKSLKFVKNCQKYQLGVEMEKMFLKFICREMRIEFTTDLKMLSPIWKSAVKPAYT